MIKKALLWFRYYRKAKDIKPQNLENMDFTGVLQKFEKEQPIIYALFMLGGVLLYHFYFSKKSLPDPVKVEPKESK